MAFSLSASLRKLACAAVSASVLGAPRAAHAEEVQLYTGQVLIADVTTLGVVGACFAFRFVDRESSTKIAAVGLLGYIGATPILHAAHCQYFAAVLSFGLRLALPLAVLSLRNGKDPADSFLLIGALAAPTVLDAAVLARPKGPTADLTTPPPPKTVVRLSPYVGAGGAGVTGSF